MNRLDTIAIRRLSDGAIACPSACADAAFQAGGDAARLGPVYAGAKVDLPACCVNCGSSFALAPTHEGLHRNLEAWLNYECQAKLSVGATAAYAKLAAYTLELALDRGWSEFMAEAPEARHTAPDDHARWSILRNVMSRRCDRYLYALANGTSAVATIANPPQNWVAKTRLNTILLAPDGSEAIQAKMAEDFIHSFQGQSLSAAGIRIALPRDISHRIERYSADGRKLSWNDEKHASDYRRDVYDLADGPADLTRAFGLPSDPRRGSVISLAERRPQLAVDAPALG